MTDAAAFTFNRLDPNARAKLFHQLFHPSQLGLNVNRVCMGASDYATKVYSYCDGAEPDPELKRFSIDHDRQWILPMLREARAQNPEMFIFGSPWSPPGWMKSNGSMLGGNMQRRYMDAHAQYFVRFVQDYGKEGIPVHAVTVNNEVDTDQDGRMPACAWPQEYEVDFIRGHLGPALKAASLDTQVWMLDHNYNLWGRALASLAEPGMLEHCQGIAWHGYVGDAARVTQVQEAYPQIGMYWTEGGPDITDPNYFDPLFIEALECKLALVTCEEITGSTSKKESIKDDYKTVSEALGYFLISFVAPALPGYPLQPVDYVPGTVFLARRIVFEQVGLLDEQYFFSGEIADFCRRAKAYGHDAFVALDVLAEHDTGHAPSRLRDTLYAYYSLRNRYLFVRKHHGSETARLFAYWTGVGSQQIARSLMRGNASRARALFLALAHGLTNRYGNQNAKFL